MRTVPESEGIEIIRELRQTTVSSVHSVSSGTMKKCDILPRLFTRAPTQGSVEFELMIRHAIAYPTLAPLDAESTWVMSQSTVLPAVSAATGVRYDWNG